MYKLSQEQQQNLSQGHLAASLDGYTIIKISGATAADYLQGQITQDINRLSDSQGIYSAILTPQGKMVSDMHIITGHDGERLIIVRKSYAENTVARLRQFALGHELRIGIVDSHKLLSIQGENSDDFLKQHNLPLPSDTHLSTAAAAERELFTIRMAEAADNGVWIVTDDTTPFGALAEASAITAAKIIRGLPTYGIDWDEKLFPLNANLIEMDGVNFDKGCYVGQEVTSRMQWRGGIKKRLYHLQLNSSPDSLPSPVSSSFEIGSISSAAIDAEGNVFAIGHLPIEVVEAGTSLMDAAGDPVEVIGACHV